MYRIYREQIFSLGTISFVTWWQTRFVVDSRQFVHQELHEIKFKNLLQLDFWFKDFGSNNEDIEV